MYTMATSVIKRAIVFGMFLYSTLQKMFSFDCVSRAYLGEINKFVSGYNGLQFNPQLYLFVVSLSMTLYLFCFN